VPVSEYEYAMITTLRNMHTSKPHVGFYKEIINYLGRAPVECLMIGDRMDDDILPATSVGIPSFWFTENGNKSAEQIDLLVGMGDMEDLLAILNPIEVI
jgi:FMN phosphatase YigB (HAD superfamily)